MGLIDQLGYRVPEANRFQRLVWKVSSSRPSAWFFSRTGERRKVPLVGVPSGDDLAVIGTRFGHPSTPGWYYNLPGPHGARRGPRLGLTQRTGKSSGCTARGTRSIPPRRRSSSSISRDRGGWWGAGRSRPSPESTASTTTWTWRSSKYDLPDKGIDDVMADQQDLLTVEHTLHQVLNCKGL